MKAVKKLFGISAAFLLVGGLYFHDNIYGHFRFKTLCAAESGLRTYAPVEPGVGWSAVGGHVAETRFPLSIKGVAFVRYRNDQDGVLYDVFSAPAANAKNEGYVQKPADLRNPVIYEYRSDQQTLAREIRMFKVIQAVVDLRTSAIAATYTTFGYREFEPSRTLLGGQSVVLCPSDEPQIDKSTGKNMPSKIAVAFSSIFKN